MSLSRSESSDAKEQPIHDERIAALSESVHDVPGSVDFSAPLESSTSLEAPRSVHIAARTTSVPLSSDTLPAPITAIGAQINSQGSQTVTSVQSTDELSQPGQPVKAKQLVPDVAMPLSEGMVKTPNLPTSVVSTETVPLLEERLVVDRHRRKVGEVVVRKEIETHVVEVLLRREKLIVEQISPEYKQLAVVDLGQQGTEASTVEAAKTSFPLTIEGKFSSVEAAQQFLEAIATHSTVDNVQALQISAVLKDANSQATYRHWLEHYSAQIAP